MNPAHLKQLAASHHITPDAIPGPDEIQIPSRSQWITPSRVEAIRQFVQTVQDVGRMAVIITDADGNLIFASVEKV